MSNKEEWLNLREDYKIGDIVQTKVKERYIGVVVNPDDDFGPYVSWFGAWDDPVQCPWKDVVRLRIPKGIIITVKKDI